jgi:hypothetical protein
MEQIVEFFAQMNIATCHRATFYRIQSLFVNPIIWEYWTQMKTTLLDELQKCGRSISVTGDGQESDVKGHLKNFKIGTVPIYDSQKETVLTPYKLSKESVNPLHFFASQFDSAGYSATYCFYTVVETSSKKVSELLLIRRYPGTGMSFFNNFINGQG